MILYHSTSEDNAASILNGGFRDGKGIAVWSDPGVWLSDKPLGYGTVMLRVEVPDSFAEFELETEGLDVSYREYLISAAKLNECPISLMTDDEEFEAVAARTQRVGAN